MDYDDEDEKEREKEMRIADWQIGNKGNTGFQVNTKEEKLWKKSERKKDNMEDEQEDKYDVKLRKKK